MKSLKKQFIAAIAMTLVAALALGSSTYAWFANNAVVTADQMQVTAKSDSAFMIIKAGHASNAAEVQVDNSSIAHASPSNACLYPAAYNSEYKASPSCIKDFEPMTSTPSNWYYSYSNDPGSSSSNGTKNDILSDKYSDYILVDEFSISTAKGSNSISDLVVKDCDIVTSGSGDAVKAIIATEDAAVEFGVGDDQSSGTVLASSVTDDSVVYVKIYIYWDGTDLDVTTNNINNLQSTSVSVLFSGTVN